jgi:hypothetical protein
MTQEKMQRMEVIVVSVPLRPCALKTVRDPHGNMVMFPSVFEKMNILVPMPKARVVTANGAPLCEVEQPAVWAIDTAKGGALIEAVFTRTYSFEAPVGSIPNLCKKAQSAHK